VEVAVAAGIAAAAAAARDPEQIQLLQRAVKGMVATRGSESPALHLLQKWCFQ